MIRKRKETKILEEYLNRDDLLDEDEQAEVVALLRDEVVLRSRSHVLNGVFQRFEIPFKCSKISIVA